MKRRREAPTETGVTGLVKWTMRPPGPDSGSYRAHMKAAPGVEGADGALGRALGAYMVGTAFLGSDSQKARADLDEMCWTYTAEILRMDGAGELGKPLTLEQLLPLMESPDETVRERALRLIGEHE